MTVVSLYHELIVPSQAELGWGLLLKGWSLTQLARPGPADPDPESDGASRRGLLGEAGGQSGKEAPVDLGPAGRGIGGRGWLVFGMGEVLPLQQQGMPFSPGKEGISLCWWHIWWTWCCAWQGLMAQQTTNLLCSPAWLLKQKDFSVLTNKNSSLWTVCWNGTSEMLCSSLHLLTLRAVFHTCPCAVIVLFLLLQAKSYIKSLPKIPKKDLSVLFPKANPQGK